MNNEIYLTSFMSTVGSVIAPYVFSVYNLCIFYKILI